MFCLYIIFYYDVYIVSIDRNLGFICIVIIFELMRKLRKYIDFYKLNLIVFILYWRNLKFGGYFL